MQPASADRESTGRVRDLENKLVVGGCAAPSRVLLLYPDYAKLELGYVAVWNGSLACILRFCNLAIPGQGGTVWAELRQQLEAPLVNTAAEAPLVPVDVAV